MSLNATDLLGQAAVVIVISSLVLTIVVVRTQLAALRRQLGKRSQA